jgi:hypothetical protein
MKTRTSKLIFFFLLDFVFFSRSPAYAYLDPGTGSYLIQMGIATFLGLLIGAKMFWHSIKMFVAGLFGKRPADSVRNAVEDAREIDDDK